jgi:MYXO-CTERM domain-containing protein
MKLKNAMTAGVFALGAAAFAIPASGTVIFTGTGTGEAGGTVSGSASFMLSGSTLTLILSNTSAAHTGAQGDAITGIVFSIAGSGQTLSFTMSGAGCGPTLPSGSHIFTGKTTQNDATALCGAGGSSWTSAFTPGGPVTAEFGVATTGFNGEFNGGSIGIGNASPNYGIVAPGTFPTATFGGSQFPFIQNALQFVFTTGGTSFGEGDITGVNFLVGTSGADHFLGDCTTSCVEKETPEPDSLALAGLAGLLLAFAGRRRTQS